MAANTTLLNVARGADNLFDLEMFLTRERVGDSGGGHGHGGNKGHGGAAPDAGETPEAAGGAL